MNHVAVHLKLRQYCKSTILQLKKKKERKSSPKNRKAVLTCVFLTMWTDQIKDNLEYQWPLWETFEIPKLNFLEMNWATITQKLSELSSILILIDSLRLPYVIRSLKLPH